MHRLPTIAVVCRVMFGAQVYAERTFDEYCLMLQATNEYDYDAPRLMTNIFDAYFESVLIPPTDGEDVEL